MDFPRPHRLHDHATVFRLNTCITHHLLLLMHCLARPIHPFHIPSCEHLLALPQTLPALLKLLSQNLVILLLELAVPRQRLDLLSLLLELLLQALILTLQLFFIIWELAISFLKSILGLFGLAALGADRPGKHDRSWSVSSRLLTALRKQILWV